VKNCDPMPGARARIFFLLRIFRLSLGPTKLSLLFLRG